MTTYTMVTTIEGRNGTRVETNTRLAEGDVQALREAAAVTAEDGDSVTHKVTTEAVQHTERCLSLARSAAYESYAAEFPYGPAADAAALVRLADGLTECTC